MSAGIRGRGILPPHCNEAVICIVPFLLNVLCEERYRDEIDHNARFVCMKISF